MTTNHQHYKDPSPEEQSDFALRLYFGAGNPRELVVHRAYLDLRRTVHGIKNYRDAQRKAHAYLKSVITALPGNKAITGQKSFDTWHEKTCDKLCKIFDESGYKSFHIGQAQKWINMALKYLYVFGETRAPGYSKFYRYCHVPVDNIILESQAFKDLRSFREAWSRIPEYSKYIAFQIAVRKRYHDSSPLAVEFWVWQGKIAT